MKILLVILVLGLVGCDCETPVRTFDRDNLFYKVSTVYEDGLLHYGTVYRAANDEVICYIYKGGISCVENYHPRLEKGVHK